MKKIPLLCISSTQLFFVLAIILLISCTAGKHSDLSDKKAKITLITIDPGHYHSALVQKFMYPQIDSNAFVYGPEGEGVNLHQYLINTFNERNQKPTHWNEIVYKGPDFLNKALNNKNGNLVILAGNNKNKSFYIKKCIESGLNVLADNPMIINSSQFKELLQSFRLAKNKGLILDNIMTERFDITNVLQKEIINIPEIFGKLEKGTIDNPAIYEESIHYLYKIISGIEVVRPTWFFDTNQRGEGIVDVASHLVDLVQWECFPQQVINYETEIDIIDASHWQTTLSMTQYEQLTRTRGIPANLRQYVNDNVMQIYTNGEITYKIKGVHAKVAVKWDFSNTEGHNDLHYSTIRGTKASITIRQGKEENYNPTLYIEPRNTNGNGNFENIISQKMIELSRKYPGLNIIKKGKMWEVVIPDTYKVGHETHFDEAMQQFFHYWKDGELPEWEVPNMLAKYYITTKGLDIAKAKD